MVFTYTYRAKSGALAEGAQEAPSRMACCGILKARGITPLSIKEDAVDASIGGVRKPSGGVVKGVGGCIAFAAIALLWWHFTRAGSAHSESSSAKDGMVQHVVERSPGDLVPSASHARGEMVSSTNGTKRRNDERLRTENTVYAGEAGNSGQTYDGGDVLTNAVAPTPEQRLEEVKRRMKFKTAEEQLLSMATPDVPGDDVPPLPISPEERDSLSTAKGLSNILKPEVDDDEKLLQKKADVTEMKFEYHELKKEGWTFAQYVTALAEKRKDEADFLRESRRLNEELRNDASLSNDEYEDARKKINEALREKGLPEIEAPNHEVENEKATEEGKE